MVCTGCDLYKCATNIRLENQHSSNSIMIIGDCPNYAEDATGELFTCATGKYLYRELLSVGINMDKCYTSKAVKCYSPTAPTKAQIKACKQYLIDEINDVKPSYILILGATALYSLTNTTNLTKHRGKIIQAYGAKCIATYHPAAVIRSPDNLYVFRADLNYFSHMVNDVWRPPMDFKWQVVDTPKGLERLRNSVNTHREFAYDIETNSLKDKINGKILMVGIATPEKVFIIPFEQYGKKDTDADWQNAVKSILNAILKKSEGKVHIAQNGKFDNHWLRSRGITPWLDFDTYLASYCLNVNLPHDLKYNAKVEFGAADYAADVEYTDDYPFEKMAEYCALDCYYTLKWYYILKKKLLNDRKLALVYKYIVMPGSRVLEQIEENGVYINYNKLVDIKEKYKDKLVELNDELNKMADVDHTFNWNSPTQLAKLLFDKIGLLPVEITATGAPSTNKSTLKYLATLHPIPAKVLEYRNYDKALNTFIVPWEERLKEEISCGKPLRLHPTYNIAQTATGRLSCNDPNLQQVTKDKNVRSLVSVPPGRKLIEADQSQIELRIAAFIADATSMKNVYRNGGDIHTNTAATVARVPVSAVTKDMRKKAKPVNFGFLYGMWWKSFKSYAFNNYDIVYTDEEAQKAREGYFNAYPELLVWHERQKNEVRTYKYVRSPLGRIRHLPNIDSPDKDLRNEAERQAINTPVQSMASDVTMLVMIHVNEMINPKKAMLVGQIHDAILVECDDDYVDDVCSIIQKAEEMTIKDLTDIFGVNIDLPLVIDISVGDGWGMGVEWVPKAQKFVE